MPEYSVCSYNLTFCSALVKDYFIQTNYKTVYQVFDVFMCSPLTVWSFNSNLLDSKADGIEVSYNACGVLSHIMFDGPEVWSMEEPRRDTVMDKMWDAIQSWDVSSRRNINYRCCSVCVYLNQISFLHFLYSFICNS